MPGGAQRVRPGAPRKDSALPLLARHDPWPSVMSDSYSTGFSPAARTAHGWGEDDLAPAFFA
jgi:hypothetical protein